MSSADETVGWRAARAAAFPERGGLSLEVPGGGEIFFRKILKRRFLMGARGEQEDEEPRTEQEVEEFFLGTFPVTQGQFRGWTESSEYGSWLLENESLLDEESRGAHRNEFSGSDFLPVEKVSWYEAGAFAEWLQGQEEFREGLLDFGLDPEEWGLALPSEGQWELACRGDSRSEYSLGEGKEVLKRQGWFDETSERMTHPVGGLEEGPHGLYEMHGNVQEWCRDYFHENAARESLPGGKAVVRVDHPPAQTVSWVFTESERFFGKILKEDRVVLAEDRRIIEVWKEELGRQGLDGFSRICERALVQRADSHGRWPDEDSGLAQQLYDIAVRNISGAERGEARVLRGGSWLVTAGNCRSACRFGVRPGRRNWNVGFRLALVPGPGEPVRQGAGGPSERAVPKAAAVEARDETEQAQAEGGAGGGLSGATFPPRSGDAISEIVLSSKDGETWYREREWAGSGAGEKVVKIVLGTLARNGADFGFAFDDLENVAANFSDLRQLCLWGVKGLVELGGLPSGLERLEVRNCPEFEILKKLPDGLVSLDLGGCSSLKRLPALPKGLKELYLDRCPGLHGARLAVLLEDSQFCSLEEVDGSESAAFETLEWLPDGIRRVRFKGCPKLETTGALSRCSDLEILDLNECKVLNSLGKLPGTLQFLAVSGCEGLTSFAGSGVSALERGEAGANVAPHFLGLQKYGDEKRLWVAAKVLLLGDGRVGKSTLAKRLQWDDPDFPDKDPELKPDGEEDPTHAIRYFDWKTKFKIPGEIRMQAGGALEDGCLTGEAAIWDFGGQELYHQTHRLFAGSGSVFVIVWKDGEPDLEKLNRECPEDVLPAVWREMNRRRPLQYWFDYVDAMRPDAEVVLVCTECPAGKSRPDWKKQAPEFAKSKEAEKMKVFFVDSLYDAHAGDPDFGELRRWLRDAMGRMAGSLGLVKPKLFVDVADEVALLRRESEQEKGTGIPICKWADWEEKMAGWYEEKVGRGEWSREDAEVITSYLHERGSLFRVRGEGRESVMVDQVRGTDLIYAILEPGKEIYRAVREHRGWFTLSELKRVPRWECLNDNEVAREQVLKFIKECGLLIEIVGRDERYFIANHRWLLPGREDMQRSYGELLKMVRERDGNEEREDFRFEVEKISEFEFSQLRKHLASRWKRRAYFGADQLAFFDDKIPARWGFWVDFQEDPKGRYYGKIDGHLSAPRGEADRLREDFELLFYETGSPLAGKVSGRVSRRLGPGVGQNLLEKRGFLKDAEVGISSSGKDGETALKIKAFLDEQGIPTVWYGDDDCRQGEDRKVEHFMKVRLGQTKVRLFLLSDHYLGTDLRKNWYCPWELADRILQCADDPGEIERTLVVYLKIGEDQTIDSQSVTMEVTALFEKLRDSFSEQFSKLTARQMRNAKYLIEQMEHFDLATENERVMKFFDSHSNRGWYSRADEKEGELDLAGLIADVREALRVK